MNRTADIEFNDVCRQLDDYLREHDMRRTPERYAIVRRAMALNSYFSVDSLCSALDDEAFHVSRTTVYNTVQLLVDASILRPLRLLGNDTRYCFAMRHNDESDSVYLVCLDCGKIKEVKGNDAAAKLRTTQFRGFYPRYQSLCVYGSCASCRRKTRRNSLTGSSRASDKAGQQRNKKTII